ncbi:MAG: TerC family protein [Pseudolabrys sp.]|nr:TerC family protein [Pseudolabrys sp.]
MDDLFSQAAIAAFLQVIMIDLVLAGDNAVVIGIAAGGLAPHKRHRAILVGVLAATLLRIAFAAVAIELLAVIGLLLAGGILLLWVCWKMWRELRGREGVEANSVESVPVPRKTFAQAVWQIVMADISMSLDNVLAVAGAARDHPAALAFGLGLSVVLMGFAANLIATLLHRQRWIAYVGLAIILYVALDMIWRGFAEVWPHLTG